MRLARFALIGLVSGTTVGPTPDDSGLGFIEAYRRCYEEVSPTATMVAHPSGRAVMDAAAFQAIKDCARQYLKK
jgi:hypothetical protein